MDWTKLIAQLNAAYPGWVLSSFEGQGTTFTIVIHSPDSPPGPVTEKRIKIANVDPSDVGVV